MVFVFTVIMLFIILLAGMIYISSSGMLFKLPGSDKSSDKKKVKETDTKEEEPEEKEEEEEEKSSGISGLFSSLTSSKPKQEVSQEKTEAEVIMEKEYEKEDEVITKEPEVVPVQTDEEDGFPVGAFLFEIEEEKEEPKPTPISPPVFYVPPQEERVVVEEEEEEEKLYEFPKFFECLLPARKRFVSEKLKCKRKNDKKKKRKCLNSNSDIWDGDRRKCFRAAGMPDKYFKDADKILSGFYKCQLTHKMGKCPDGDMDCLRKRQPVYKCWNDLMTNAKKKY